MEACFPCLGARKRSEPAPPLEAAPGDPHHRNNVAAAARTYSVDELAAATRGFNDAYVVAGKEPSLFRAQLKNQLVALKLEHLDGRHEPADQLNSEFLARVLMLDALRHPNLVGLIGFCADGTHRILVHEYVPLGSLEDRLHDPSPEKVPLNWSTRMNVAAGVARALEYLHEKGAVYRFLGSSDILLAGDGDGDGDGDGCHRPKLSPYGLAKAGQFLDEHFQGRDFDRTAGVIALETATTGRLTPASDVYSFGVLLLELITGRRAFDRLAAEGDRSLGIWARPLLQDRAGFRRMADPALQGRYPSMDLEEALTVASMCIHQDPRMRSPIGAVVSALARLAYDQPS